MKFLADFFPIILFFVTYKLYGIYAATAVAIGASVIQVSYHWLRNRQVEKMHLITMVMLLVFGGLTLLLQDRTFIMWKPSVINWLFGAVFIGSHFIGEKPLAERMMGNAVRVPSPVWRRLNLAWGGFFVLLGLANLYVASFFFSAEAALTAQTGLAQIDLTSCGELFNGDELQMCLEMQSLEADWVNFKLFGMMGLTLAFVLLQAFYLARHMQDQEQLTEEN
jgi:intracellular septation protein